MNMQCNYTLHSILQELYLTISQELYKIMILEGNDASDIDRPLDAPYVDKSSLIVFYV